MKRLVFAKPVTRRLTPESNDYTNPSTNCIQDPHDT